MCSFFFYRLRSSLSIRSDRVSKKEREEQKMGNGMLCTYSQAIWAAWHRRKNIVCIHCAQHQWRAVPFFGAESKQRKQTKTILRVNLLCLIAGGGGFALIKKKKTIADWGQNLRCNIFNFLTCIEWCDPARHLQDIPCTPMSSTGSVLRILPFWGMQDKNTFFNLFIFCVLVATHFHRSTLPSLGDDTRLWRTPRNTINFHFYFIVFFFWLLSPTTCRCSLATCHLLSKLILRITDTYLNASRCMLFWAEEKCAIDKWISVKYKHRLLAEYARYATLLMLRQRRQYEQSGLVVAMIPFVFHLHRHEKRNNEKNRQIVKIHSNIQK